MSRKDNQLLLNVVRKMIPIKYRQTLGLWTMAQAARTKWLLYPCMFFLCGAIPKGLKMLPDGVCRIQHSGLSIICPRDGIFTAWEVLQDEIYEKMYRPGIGQVVLDVGAYVGMFAVKAAMQVGVRGTVVAIEPSTSNLKYLHYNTRCIPNVIVVPVAAGAIRSQGELSLSIASPCHSLTQGVNSLTENVSIRPLDDIVSELGIEHVDFIKIDVEGFELEVLKGASDTLRNNKLKLAVAAYHNLPTGEQELPFIQLQLASYGFKTTVMKGYIYAEN